MKERLKQLGLDAVHNAGEDDSGWDEETDDRKVTATKTTLTIKASFSHFSGDASVRETFKFTVDDGKLIAENSDEECPLDSPNLQLFVNDNFFFDGN